MFFMLYVDFLFIQVKVYEYLMSWEKLENCDVKVMFQYNVQCFVIRDVLKKKRFINFKVIIVVFSQGKLYVKFQFCMYQVFYNIYFVCNFYFLYEY